MVNLILCHTGFGLMQQAGPAYYTLYGLAIFVVQIILSTVWLHFFKHGSVEWLWRSASYGRWRPFRKEPRRGQPAPTAV